MNPGWLDGFGGSPRARPARIEQANNKPAIGTKSGPLIAWKEGQSRTVVEVACCPKCGSVRVKIRTTRGDAVVLMECRECKHQWKDERVDHIA